MPESKEIELRSEEVQDILSKVPHWMIRWGTVLIFAIIMMLFFVSWFLKYPDIVRTEVVITTNIPPEKIVAKTTGRIEAILVRDKEVTTGNTTLAIIENNANYKDVFVLKNCMEHFDLNGTTKFPFHLLDNAQLGDVENAYAIFQKEYIAEELNSQLQPFQLENNSQRSENAQLKERLRLLEQQKTINERVPL